MPFPPGGPTDIVARPFARMLGEALQANLIVDNRGGAGGSIGAALIAQSPPDGQSLLVGTVGTNAMLHVTIFLLVYAHRLVRRHRAVPAPAAVPPVPA